MEHMARKKQWMRTTQAPRPGAAGRSREGGDHRSLRGLNSRCLEAALPAKDQADGMELRDRHSRRLGGWAISLHTALQVGHAAQSRRGIRCTLRPHRPHGSGPLRYLLDAAHGQMVAALYRRDACRGASNPRNRRHPASGLTLAPQRTSERCRPRCSQSSRGQGLLVGTSGPSPTASKGCKLENVAVAGRFATVDQWVRGCARQRRDTSLLLRRDVYNMIDLYTTIGSFECGPISRSTTSCCLKP